MNSKFPQEPMEDLSEAEQQIHIDFMREALAMVLLLHSLLLKYAYKFPAK